LGGVSSTGGDEEDDFDYSNQSNRHQQQRRRMVDEDEDDDEDDYFSASLDNSDNDNSDNNISTSHHTHRSRPNHPTRPTMQRKYRYKDESSESSMGDDDGSDSEGGVLSAPGLKACMQLLKELRKNRVAFPFNQPVDPNALGLPDYFDVITKPMDLGTIHVCTHVSPHVSIFFPSLIQLCIIG
jgi:hypothetical protein